MHAHLPASPHFTVCQHCCNPASDLLTSHCATETTGICIVTNESQVGGKKMHRGGEKCWKMPLNFQYDNTVFFLWLPLDTSFQ